LVHNAASNPHLFNPSPRRSTLHKSCHSSSSTRSSADLRSPLLERKRKRSASSRRRRLTMVPSRKDGLGGDEDSDRSPDGDAAEGYRENEGSASAADHPLCRGGVVERLRGLLRGESDGDLSHEGSRGGEDGLLRWLQALDLQVLGACRADERSKPLFKLNVSSGPAEERLLAQLSQVHIVLPR
ncbi:hypothetical protein GW17_00022970, partial [Ensete ventricosum]